MRTKAKSILKRRSNRQAHLTNVTVSSKMAGPAICFRQSRKRNTIKILIVEMMRKGNWPCSQWERKIMDLSTTPQGGTQTFTCLPWKTMVIPDFKIHFYRIRISRHFLKSRRRTLYHQALGKWSSHPWWKSPKRLIRAPMAARWSLLWSTVWSRELTLWRNLVFASNFPLFSESCQWANTPQCSLMRVGTFILVFSEVSWR